MHMFLDAGGERVELLAYDCPASHGGPRMCGFEVFARLPKKGALAEQLRQDAPRHHNVERRNSGPFWDQLAAGESSSLEEAKAAALEMVSRPRDAWTKLPRSWVK